MSWKPNAVSGPPAAPMPSGDGPAAAAPPLAEGHRAGGSLRGAQQSSPGAAPPTPTSVVRWSSAAQARGALPAALAQSTGTALRLVWPSAGLPQAARPQALQWLQAAWPVASAGGTAQAPAVLPVAVQVWSPAFLAQWLDGQSAAPGWLAAAPQRLGVSTPTGPQLLHLRLWWPAGAAPGGLGQPQQTAAVVNAPTAPFRPLPPTAASLAAGPAVSPALVQAGALAWVLAEEGQPPRSALLVLDWVPRPENSVYSPWLPTRRDDPWLLQAQWWAAGVKEKPRSPSDSPPCDVDGCPYQGVAACPHPLCPATGAVPAAGNVGCV